MSTDAGGRLPELPRPIFRLPKVLDIQIRPTRVEPPRHRNFESALPGGDGVEFIVKTDGPIPGRALGPALQVGEVVVTEVTTVGPNTYRFVAADRGRFTQDAVIRLTWTGQRPPDEKDGIFRYRLR